MSCGKKFFAVVILIISISGTSAVSQGMSCKDVLSSKWTLRNAADYRSAFLTILEHDFLAPRVLLEFIEPVTISLRSIGNSNMFGEFGRHLKNNIEYRAQNTINPRRGIRSGRQRPFDESVPRYLARRMLDSNLEETPTQIHQAHDDFNSLYYDDFNGRSYSNRYKSRLAPTLSMALFRFLSEREMSRLVGKMLENRYIPILAFTGLTSMDNPTRRDLLTVIGRSFGEDKTPIHRFNQRQQNRINNFLDSSVRGDLGEAVTAKIEATREIDGPLGAQHLVHEMMALFSYANKEFRNGNSMMQKVVFELITNLELVRTTLNEGADLSSEDLADLLITNAAESIRAGLDSNVSILLGR